MRCKPVTTISISPDIMDKITKMYLKNKSVYKSKSEFIESILKSYVEQFYQDESVTELKPEEMSIDKYVMIYLKTNYKDVRETMQMKDSEYLSLIEKLMLKEKFNYSGDVNATKRIIKIQCQKWLNEVEHERVSQV